MFVHQTMNQTDEHPRYPLSWLILCVCFLFPFFVVLAMKSRKSYEMTTSTPFFWVSFVSLQIVRDTHFELIWIDRMIWFIKLILKRSRFMFDLFWHRNERINWILFFFVKIIHITIKCFHIFTISRKEDSKRIKAVSYDQFIRNRLNEDRNSL